MDSPGNSPIPYAAPQPDPADDAPIHAPPAGVLWPLLALFATIYFVQGIVEPTAGVPAQPMQNRLEDWGQSQKAIGLFLGFIGIPWSLKPLLGLISDLLPIRGFRRLPYLVLSTAACAGLFLWMSGLWTEPSNQGLLAWLLLATCVAISLTDVVVDALAVEHGQPLGITGQLQAVQWGALSTAQILGGTLAGFVSQHSLLGPAFVGCSLLSLGSLAVVLLAVREPRGTRGPAENLRRAWHQLASKRRALILASVALYLFLWNFNPFSSNVLQHYTTEVLGLSEQFYGNLTSLQGVMQLVACVVYFFVCRRIPFPWLVHGSIACGVLSTLCYWPMHDATTAVIASLVFGLTYQTATLIQLDLAARIVPTQSAATLFAILMSISNTGMSAAYAAGGWWYDDLASAFAGNRHAAFDCLVAIGAAFTASCWLLVPVMRWAGAYEYR
jgi:MFS family permease